MCLRYNYALRVKDEFDIKYKQTGKRSKLWILGSVISYNGKKPNYNSQYMDLIMVPCGQCLECRLKRAKAKAMQSYGECRIVEESTQPYKNENGCLVGHNCFVTLTFGDDSTYEFLRKKRKLSRYMAKKYRSFLTWSLENREIPLFMKRLRKRIDKDYPIWRQKYDMTMKNNSPNIRFCHCGEYGEHGFRPHHHMIIFNFDFPDKYLWSVDKKNNVKYYRSKMLEELWPFGFCLISEVTYNTCAYVNRYITKKMTGDKKDEWYQGRMPEQYTCSNRNGIGYEYFMKYGENSIYNTDTMTMINYKGKYVSSKPPKYFDDLLERENPELFEIIKENRKLYQQENSELLLEEANDNRCRQRSTILDSISSRLVRVYEQSEYYNASQDDFYYKKGNAFGITQAVLDEHKEHCEKYLSRKTFEDYKLKSSNYAQQKYNEFLKRTLHKLKLDHLYDDLCVHYKRGKMLEPEIFKEDENAPLI